METKLANKLLRCGRQWECDPLFVPHGMAQSPTNKLKKICRDMWSCCVCWWCHPNYRSCGEEGSADFYKKICRGWLTHFIETISICKWHDSVSEINWWCLMCGGPIGKTDEYCVVLDASLHNMCSTNSTHDFSMNPVGSLQDFLIDFTGFPSDSIRVPRGCQYGIFGSSRIPFGFPWGSHSLLIWFLWTLSGFPNAVHETRFSCPEDSF